MVLKCDIFVFVMLILCFIFVVLDSKDIYIFFKEHMKKYLLIKLRNKGPHYYLLFCLFLSEVEINKASFHRSPLISEII